MDRRLICSAPLMWKSQHLYCVGMQKRGVDSQHETNSTAESGGTYVQINTFHDFFSDSLGEPILTDSADNPQLEHSDKQNIMKAYISKAAVNALQAGIMPVFVLNLHPPPADG